MGQASITVDILAKIKGWQEELAKLKAAAAKVDLGSSFGKDLTRVMKSLETQIDSMGKNMSQRLTSDSGIDSFVTKLDNVDQRFKSIGESLTTVTFDQLDPSYVTAELKDLNTQLENAKITLESANKASFNNVVGSVSSVRIALTRMGEDITKISMDEAISKLTTGIADLDNKINQATEDLRSMRAQRDQLRNEQKTLNSSPLFNITDMAQKVSEIIGSQSDYAIQKVNTQRINDYIAELKSTLTAAGVEIGEETSAINEAFNQLAGSKTAGEIRTNLINLRRVVKENSDLTSDAALNRVNLGGVATKIKEWMVDNEAAVNEAKAHLQAKIEELQISPDKAKTIVDSFVSTIKSGGWEAGKQALEQQLNDYKTTIISRRSEIETELNNLKTLISNTDTQVKRDQYTRGVAQEASTKGWDELIAKLTAENQKLADRVTNLERALQQKMDSMLSNVTGTGKNTIGSAEQGFRDNAAAAKMYKTELEQVQAREQMIGKIQGVVQRWFSIYAAVRMVTNAIKSIISTVKELDTTITEIAIVTKMDQSQLWGQMASYTSLAREYAASISGVYKVSQLYYQQGLQTSDVMALTKQTLKMARISGLDYAEATDYMTNAVRSFKMEMTEAQTIVDVYSAIAASSATDTTELASAMSKTASSAEAVGSSFENTTAMMAVMIEATRESAENIGSAMKSIISRYGEMTSDPSKLVDSEGQEMSLNRVDKALQTVGITIHDTMGEFRDFDDVIMELASKWDTIDKNTQRYIATIMAGNRQQSRFLALVSSYDRLKELSETAANSEDAAQLQFLKTLDSVDAKIQQLQTSLQALYVDTGLEKAYKGILDWLNNIAITLNNLPDLFGLPIPAIIKLGTTFASVANIVVTTFALLKARVKAIELSITKDTTTQMNTLNANSTETRKAQEASVTAAFKTQSEIRVQTFINELARMQDAYQSMRLGNGVGTLPPGVTQTYLTDGSSGGSTSGGGGTGGGLTGIAKGVTKGWAIGGLITSIVGTILSGVADNINEKTQENRNTKAAMTAGSNILQGAGLGMTVGGLKGALIGGGLGLVKGAFEAIGIATESTDEKIQNLNSTLEDTSNARIKSEDDLKTLTNYKKKYDELYKARNSSNEAYAEYIALSQEIAANYPTLISGMDDEGNYLVTLTDNYEALLAAKRAVYNADFIKEGAAQIKAYSDKDFINTMFGVAAEGSYDPNREGTGFAGAWADISSAFADNKLIGSITHYLGGLTASDWSNTSYKDILTAAWNSTNYTDRLATGSLQHDYDTLFGVHPKQGNVGFYFGNEEGTKRWVEEHQLKHSSYDEGKYSGDVIPAIAESVIGYIGEELDKGSNISEMQSHLQEYFGQEFNLNKLFGSIATNNATAELRDTYIEKIVKGLNTAATKNSVEELGLDTDSIQMSFLTESIQKKWETEWSEALKNDPNADMGTVWTSFMLRMNTEVEELFNGDELKSFYKNLTQDQIKKANKYYTEVGQYSYDALTTILEEAGYGPDLTKFITDHLAESAQTAITHFKTGMQELDTGYEITTADGETLSNLANSFSELFGADFLEGIYNNYSSILEDTSLSNEMKQTRITDLTAIYKTVSGLNATMRSKVMPLIDNADLTTLDGIYKLVEELEQIEGLNLDTTGLRDAIDQWKSNLKINLTTELQLIIDNYTTHIADLEKDLSSASKGMDFKNAAELAAKLGKSLSDFRYEAGKFYYDDVDAIIEYYDLENETLLNDLQSEIDTRKTALSGRFTVTRSISTDKPTIDQKAWADIYNILDDEDATLEQFKAALEPYKAFLEDQGLYDSLTYMFNHRVFQDHYIAGAWDSRELTSWTENYWENIKSKWEGIPEAIDTQFTESLDEIFIKADGSLETVLAEINTMNLDNIEGITKEDLITLATLYMQRTGEDAELSFSAWLEQYYADLWKDYVESTTKYTQGVKAQAFLNQGNISAFLDTVLDPLNGLEELTNTILQQMIQEAGSEQQGMRQAAEEEATRILTEGFGKRKDDIAKAIKSGNWAALSGDADAVPYLGELYNLYESINKNVMDSVMKGLKSGSYITSTDVNDYKFEELVSKGLLNKVGDHLYQVVGDYAKARAEVLASDLDEETKAGYLKQIFEEQHKDKINLLSDLLDSGGVSYDAAEAFAESLGRNASEAQAVMEEYGFQLNTLTGRYEAGTNTLQLIRNRIAELESNPDADQEELNKLRAMVDDLEKQEKRKTTAAAFTDVFSNYDKITTESAAALATALGTTYEDVVQTYLIDNGNGTFSLDMSKIQSLLQNGRAIIGDALYNELLDQVAKFYDDGLTAISNASSFIFQGTNKATDMQTFVTEFNKKTSSNYSISDMFKWDDILEAYTLKSQYLQEFLDTQRAALKEQGFDDEFIEKYIDKQVEDIRNAVNISDFYSAEVRGKGSKARRTLESAMRASLAAQEEFETENYDYYLKIAESEVGANTVEAKYIADAYLANAQAHNAARQAVIDSQVADDIAALEAGGQAAIDVMRKYSEDGELTADQVEQAYKQRFTNLSNVMEALDGLQKNSVVDATTRDILNQIPGFKVNSDGVVEKVGDLVTVYTELYTQMQSNTVATTSELNAAYAKVLTAGEQKDIDAVSALENAMGMTYDALGSLLANYGTNLKYVADHWEEYGISQIGNGKIRIDDFTTFANQIGLTDTGSEEYISAFKTYNDSLIALDRKVESEIASEIKSITEAKPGERVNLTRLWSLIQNNLSMKIGEGETETTVEAAFVKLKEALADAGVQFSNGIIKLSEQADIGAAIEAITNNELVSSMLLSSDLAELRDAVDGLLTNMIGLIRNGISGTLNNTDANSLKEFAKKLNIDIDFTETAEGLKLSTSSAMKLYLQLKQIDKLQAQSLLPDIASMSDNYSDLTSACERYNKLIKINTQSLLEEKAVLEDLIKSMMTDPNSYKFMSATELPAGWQMVENALTDLDEAKTKITAAQKSSFMGASDFVNIINAAAAYNPDFSINGMNAEQLIAAAGNSLIRKNGEFGVNLSKSGLNLDTNALSSIYKQLESGLQLFGNQATAYYDMSDQFAKISDAIHRIDPINFEEIFGKPDSQAFNSDAFKNYFNNLNKAAPELAESLSNLLINGKSLGEIIKSGDWDVWETAGFTKETFSKFIEGIDNIDWTDASQAAAHVSDLISQSGIGPIDLEVDPNSFIHITTAGEALKIDLNDSQLRNKVIQEYNKYIKGSNGTKATAKNITDKLQELAQEYETVDVPEKINIRRILAIAEGRFDPKNFKKNKDGSWSYTYNGNTFTAKTPDGQPKQSDETLKEDLGKQIAQAIMLEDDGFDVEVEGGTITGHQLIGNMVVDVSIDDSGHYEYIVNGEKFKAQTYKDLLKELAQKGMASEKQAGTKVELENGKEGTVKIDSYTGLVYTYYVDDDGQYHYIFEGHTFNDYSSFRTYMNLRSKFSDGEISDSPDKSTRTIKIAEGLEIVYDFNTNSIQYLVNGVNVQNPDNFKAWQTAMGEDDFKFEKVGEGEGLKATFTANGIPIEIIQNTDGTLTYTYTDGQGNQFTAHDLEGYENMLRGIAAVNGGDLGTVKGGNYTITANNVTVTVNTDGTVIDSEGKVLTADDLKDLGLGNLASIPATIDTNVNITADDQASSVIKKVEEALISLASKTYTATVTAKVDTNAGAKGNAGSPRSTKSKTFFNTALVGGTPTLMGELGPELVVSNGRYFIVGESGAEMVPLEKDAVVFNHIQTRQLLTNGKTGRGVPKTNERTAVGMVTGNVHGGPARLRMDTTPGSGSGTPSTQQAAVTLSDDAKSKLSSLISDALSKGFENLDWSDYEKELGSMMDEIKNTAHISYRTFIDTYASQCDKTTSEINELYFQAWQKDLEGSMDSEDIVSAAEGLNFYANGNIGGSASDWQSIIGDRALITDLVKKGIMSYDAATKQYFVTNAEALANAGVDISQIEGIQEMIYDSLRSQYDQIVDYIGNGLEGSLTAMDSKSLQSLVERMGITGLQLDFEQTVNGLKLSQASAISLYNELKKVDSIAAQLTFNELVENLQESNDNYKTMTSLLSHIEDLSLKIQDANSYSDERIKQYTEELALAKEIAAVRATSADESMSWYDESIPAGMQNVLDYRQSWADAIDMMRDAQETGVFNFTGFINTAKQINSQAQTLGQTLNFCGYELNGTSEAIDAFITAAANSLGAVTNDNGTNFGVVLEKFGADLTDGAASYENSATSAMQTFAKSQIQILDGLIQMFEMIVAMESFKGVDENDNGLLDWKELFNLDGLEENSTEFAQYIKTEFKTAAQQILDNARSNEDLQKALTSVKVNGNTMQELLEYATGAIDKLTYSMTAGDYQKAMSVFYNLLASGDYNLDNIASSLKEALATSGSDFKGTIEYGNFVLDMKYGVTISKTSTGTYKSKSGQEYPTAAEACKATVLEEAGLENDQIVWSADKEVASGTVTYKSFSVEIIADAEGARYNYNGVAYNSLEDATMAAWNAAGGEQGTQLTFDEWKIQQGITVVTTVSKVDTSNISKSQIDKLVGTSWQEIKSKWDAATAEGTQEEFQIEYGFTLDNETTEADFNEMKERLGITENRMELTLAITNLDEIAAEFASKMTNITLNPTSADATGSATVTADTTEAVTSIGAVEEAINKVIKAIEYLNTLKVAIDKGTAEADMQAIEDATKNAEEAVGKLNGAVSGLTTQFGYLNGTLNTLQGYLSSLSNSTISINAVGQEVLGTIAQDLRSISTDIASLKEKEVKGQIVLNITTGGGEGGGVPGATATGNVIGNDAFAAGFRQVLMGELGPELYVTGGRYYVAGQSGAEFVNLPNDAIVFNHLQTRKLLSTGAAGRGKPVTNEKAATSLATGNAIGLAMANAQQTLATLKQLRAMWQSLANASITDMVGLANMKDTESSSDSGGNKIDRKAWIETLEKWYNWLQKIAELEKEINYEEQLRSTLETRQGPKGKELYESQKRELEMIKQQYAVQKSLVDSRREYFEARRAQLNSSVFGKFYQFDEHGQQFYTRGTKFEFGKTAEYAAAQKAAQANGGSGATTTTMTNAAPEMTKHTAEWNKSIENLALAIYNNRAQTQWSRLSDGSISSRINHYETMDQALKWAQTLYRIDENGKATYLGNPTAKGDPLAYSDVSGRLWDIWVKNIGVDFDRLQSGEKQRSNMDQNALNASSEYKKLLSQTIQDTAKAVGQEVSGGSTGGGAAGANPPRSELAQITQIEGGFAALMELWARDPQTLEPKYTPAEQYAIAQSLGFGNYMLYDQSGNKIEPGENGQDDTFYTSALQALTDNLDADREEMQSLYDSIEEDEKKLLELEQKQNELLLAIRDNQIDVENKILDAIEAREQAIIDELSDTKEVLEDNADKYINGLNEALSNEQRMYQSNKSQSELESLRRQLAILQRSGGSASQINSLQQQIDAKEQENYFDAQQQQIDAIQAASDLEIERLDKQIEIMETTLEYSKEHGLLWAEVSQIMQQDDAVIMDFLLSNTAEYLASSALQQSATYDELLSMVNQWTAYRDDQNKYRPLQEDMEIGLEDIMANIFSTDANAEDSNVISAIIGSNAQVVQGIQAATETTKSSSGSGSGSSGGSYSYDERGSGGSISGASRTGSAVGGTGNAEYNAWLREQGNNLGASANWQMAIAQDGNYSDADLYKVNATQTGKYAAKTLEKAGEGNGTWTFTRNFVYDTSNDNGKNYSDWALKNIQTDLQNLKDPDGKYKDMPDDWKQNKINVYTDVLRQNGVRGYSSGGSVDYTGLAMVHGTPIHPEYFLDAEETKMWKSDILGSNSSSLTSRLLALREILNGIESASSHINNSTDNGVIIEKAEVNVDVAQLANDYDARRAGDTIMDEILQIARKTGVSSVRR